jgi:hypothetical protein
MFAQLLIRGRKFDLRIWVLLTDDGDVYLYLPGYVRTSSGEGWLFWWFWFLWQQHALKGLALPRATHSGDRHIGLAAPVLLALANTLPLKIFVE